MIHQPIAPVRDPLTIRFILETVPIVLDRAACESDVRGNIRIFAADGVATSICALVLPVESVALSCTRLRLVRRLLVVTVSPTAQLVRCERTLRALCL